ncbi:unnamed protein product [Mucor fragilis]
MAGDIKMLQKRLFEATRLLLTMPEDGTFASNAGALKRQLIMAKENYQLLFDDVVKPGSSAPFSNNNNNIVPSDTPYIQWKGHKFNNKKFIFPTMDACFQQFQDVLESRGMSVETQEENHQAQDVYWHVCLDEGNPLAVSSNHLGAIQGTTESQV